MTDKIKLLLVEDDAGMAMVIKETLEALDFDIKVAADGEQGLTSFLAQRPQIVVVDVMMPKMDGFEMANHIRQYDSIIPILFLTARTAVGDVVEGFKSGGDDYFRKPFSMQELIVRIRSLVEKANRMSAKESSSQSHEISLGRYDLDVDRQTLTLGDECTNLSYRETHILRMLAESKGEVVTSRELLLTLCGDDSFFNSRSLYVFITKLRHKLSGDPSVRFINVRGIGYRLVVEK